MPWLHIQAIMSDFGYIFVVLDLYPIGSVLNGMIQPPSCPFHALRVDRQGREKLQSNAHPLRESENLQKP